MPPAAHQPKRGHRPAGLPRRAVLVATLALACGAALSGRPARARPVDDIVRAGTLKVAVYRDNPPFSFSREGTLTGVDVDIAKRIADHLGVAIGFMEITADEKVDDDLRNAVWKGHVLWHGVADLMLSVPYDPELGARNGQVVLFAPYVQESFLYVGDPARMKDGQSLGSLRSSRIGVELDTLPDFFLRTAMNGVLRDSIVHYPTTEAAAQALVAGQVAAVMGTRSRLESALGPHIAQYAVEPAHLRGFGKESWPLGIAVKENSRDLGYAAEDVVNGLVKSGEMARIFRAYGLTYQAPST